FQPVKTLVLKPQTVNSALLTETHCVLLKLIRDPVNGARAPDQNSRPDSLGPGRNVSVCKSPGNLPGQLTRVITSDLVVSEEAVGCQRGTRRCRLNRDST